MGAAIFLFYYYRNKLIGGTFISRHDVTPLVNIIVTSFLAAPVSRARNGANATITWGQIKREMHHPHQLFLELVS